MYPGRAKVNELRERFGITNGLVLEPHRYKNLNWYLCQDKVNKNDPGEWFNFGDIDEEMIERLPKKIGANEYLVLGWKDLGPDSRADASGHTGGDVWMILTHGGVIYDVRRDGKIKEANA